MTGKSVKRKMCDGCDPDTVPLRIVALRKRLAGGQKALAKELGVDQSTISEWENGKYSPSRMALIAIGRFDVDNAAWWYERAGASELTQREGTRLRGEGSAPVDPDLLASVMEALDAVMARLGIALPRKMYAAIAARAYDRWQETGRQDEAFVEKLVASACRPSNQKVRTR